MEIKQTKTIITIDDRILTRSGFKKIKDIKDYEIRLFSSLNSAKQYIDQSNYSKYGNYEFKTTKVMVEVEL